MAGLQTMTEPAARTLAEEINNAHASAFRAEPIPAKHGHWQVRLTYRPDSPLARILTLPNERSWQDVKAMWDVA